MKNKFEILTGRTQEHLVPFGDFFIDKDTMHAFEALKARLELFEVNLQIVSSFRSYERQSQIWNAKAQGQRDLYDKDGQLLDYNSLNKKEVLASILTWSAIPGASRHHWGTDIDVFDLNIKSNSQVKLTNEEYENEFKNLTQAINKIISNSSSFFRPYSEYQGGVSKELWHLSFAQKSKVYLEEYTIEIFEQNMHESNIELKDLIMKDLEHYYKCYILNINTNSI